VVVVERYGLSIPVKCGGHRARVAMRRQRTVARVYNLAKGCGVLVQWCGCRMASMGRYGGE